MAKIVGFIKLKQKPVEKKQTCWKVPYDTAKEARNTILYVGGRKTRHECRAYKCDVCGKHHVTSQKSERLYR